MILVDTSVIIDALRKPDPRLQGLFTTYVAAICGVTHAEVLYGARDAADGRPRLLHIAGDAQPQRHRERFWSSLHTWSRIADSSPRNDLGVRCLHAIASAACGAYTRRSPS